MKVEVRRQGLDAGLGVHAPDSRRRQRLDDTYVLFRDNKPCWQAVTTWGEHGWVPFREELVWDSAGVAVVGGGAAVHFLDLANGAPRWRLEVPCLFGNLELDQGEPGHRPEALYVLGWTDIIAVDPTLQIRWSARDVAVDGVIFYDAAGPILRFGVEMDPPGGWFQIELDAQTGRELSRTPNFSSDYSGLYGSGGP
jgi:hypothetical protein